MNLTQQNEPPVRHIVKFLNKNWIIKLKNRIGLSQLFK